MNSHPVLIVLAIAVAAPLLTEIPVGVRLPVAVLEMVLGIIIGPQVLGFELIPGAFAAGMVVGLASRGEAGTSLRHKVEAVYFGFLVPFFFVTSGIKFDLATLLHSAQAMLLLPAFLILLFIVRGVPGGSRHVVCAAVPDVRRCSAVQDRSICTQCTNLTNLNTLTLDHSTHGKDL